MQRSDALITFGGLLATFLMPWPNGDANGLPSEAVFVQRDAYSLDAGERTARPPCQALPAARTTRADAAGLRS